MLSRPGSPISENTYQYLNEEKPLPKQVRQANAQIAELERMDLNLKTMSENMNQISETVESKHNRDNTPRFTPN